VFDQQDVAAWIESVADDKEAGGEGEGAAAAEGGEGEGMEVDP